MRLRGQIGVLTVAVLAATILTGPAAAADAWTQWGGAERDFTLEGRKLSRDWGESGPNELWSRPLGGGFASIVNQGKTLYVAYRDGDDELVAALEASTGKTRWEYRYAAAVPESQSISTQYGKGPNSTPLLVGGKIVTMGFMGHVHCLDAEKGTLLWSHDMGKEFEVKVPYFGHAASPLEVNGNPLIVAGGLFLFDLKSGKVVWKNQEFEGTYGSPRLVKRDGKTQIVSPVAAHLAGFDPGSGKTLWSEEHKNQWGTILTSPVVDDSGRVFISAAGAGAILVDPTPGAETRQLWKGDKTQIAHSNAVRAGDWVFASTGDASTFIAATSWTDGSQAWKERGFARSNLLRVGDDFLLLDFEGELAMVEMNGEGMKVVTRATINDQPTWTPPTLLGTTLYVRDEHRIMALDLAP